MNHLLVSILEKSLSSISDSNVKAFATPYLADRQKPQSFLGLMYDQPLFAGVLVAVFLLLCFFVFISVFFRQRQKREAKVNEELTKAIKEAKNANKAKSEFLSRLSHDIRTPINIINGMVFALFGVSMPNFWLGLMLIILFSLKLGWLPSGGKSGFLSIILPALTVGLGLAALITRTTRSSMSFGL